MSDTGLDPGAENNHNTRNINWDNWQILNKT